VFDTYLKRTIVSAFYNISRLFVISEAESVYCAVGTESLYKTDTFRVYRHREEIVME